MQGSAQRNAAWRGLERSDDTGPRGPCTVLRPAQDLPCKAPARHDGEQCVHQPTTKFTDGACIRKSRRRCAQKWATNSESGRQRILCACSDHQSCAELCTSPRMLRVRSRCDSSRRCLGGADPAKRDALAQFKMKPRSCSTDSIKPVSWLSIKPT